MKEKKISDKKIKSIWKVLVDSECIRPESNNEYLKYGKVSPLEKIDQESLTNVGISHNFAQKAFLSFTGRGHQANHHHYQPI